MMKELLAIEIKQKHFKITIFHSFESMVNMSDFSSLWIKNIYKAKTKKALTSIKCYSSLLIVKSSLSWMMVTQYVTKYEISPSAVEEGMQTQWKHFPRWLKHTDTQWTHDRLGVCGMIFEAYRCSTCYSAVEPVALHTAWVNLVDLFLDLLCASTIKILSGSKKRDLIF